MVRARLAGKGGVRLGWHKLVRDQRDSMGDSPFRRFGAEAAVARECVPTAEQVYQQAPVLFTKRSR